ncbi:MAG: hypothetical protein NTZ58_02690 [Solirubrobacterales bacterium]|nr:hypothetical protein [Solirubrobacterales bacterium]
MTPPPTAASATAGRITSPRPLRRGRSLPRPSRPTRHSIGRAGVASGGLLARLFVGRRLIGVLAVALIGLVFVQVSLLKLNTRISADAERSQMLTRENAEQRSLLARLDGAQRVTGAAGNLGLVMPAPDAVCYLKASDAHACKVSGAVADPAIDPSTDPNSLPSDQTTLASDPNATTDQTGTQLDQGAVQQTDNTGQVAPDAQTQAPEPTADPGGLAAGAAN